MENGIRISMKLQQDARIVSRYFPHSKFVQKRFHKKPLVLERLCEFRQIYFFQIFFQKKPWNSVKKAFLRNITHLNSSIYFGQLNFKYKLQKWTNWAITIEKAVRNFSGQNLDEKTRPKRVSLSFIFYGDSLKVIKEKICWNFNRMQYRIWMKDLFLFQKIVTFQLSVRLIFCPTISQKNQKKETHPILIFETLCTTSIFGNLTLVTPSERTYISDKQSPWKFSRCGVLNRLLCYAQRTITNALPEFWKKIMHHSYRSTPAKPAENPCLKERLCKSQNESETVHFSSKTLIFIHTHFTCKIIRVVCGSP